jgi:hypothetical protein
MERSAKVPEIMYQSFLALQNPRKFAVFDHICRARGKVATKDIEVAFQRSGFGETLGYIADTLRELERVKLAKYVGDDFRTQTKDGDWKQTFKCYEATEHGQYIHTLCRSYDSDRPLANLGGSLDPKRVVESFAKLQKDELAIMLNRFRDMYLLGAALISIHYQKHESATSGWLSNCLDGRLSKDGVEQFLAEYTGPEGLVVARSPDWPILDRALIKLAKALVGRRRVRKWLSNASYSLTPDGKRIALTLLDEFVPLEFGVNEQYLRPEKLEADDGILGRALLERFVILGVFIAVPAYSWWDLFRKLNLAPSDAVGIAVDLIMFIATFVGLIFYGIFRLPGLLTRIVYWRKVRRSLQSTPSARRAPGSE